MVGMYFVPPRDAKKKRKGRTNAIGSIKSIQPFPEKKSVVFIRLKNESKSIIVNVKRPVPDGAKSISSKISLAFLSNVLINIKHLAFTNYYIKRNIVLLEWNIVINKSGI